MLFVRSQELTYEVDRDIVDGRQIDVIIHGQEDITLALALELGSELLR